MDNSAPPQGGDSGWDRYRRALDENDRRPADDQWPDKSMQKAAPIAPSDAHMVREYREPDTPRTAKARQFMDNSAPPQGGDSGRDRYRRALDENDRRPPADKWPDKSMQKAVPINPSDARTVRKRRDDEDA